MSVARKLELKSGALTLAARHDLPAGAPPPRGPRAAIVCHPHPLYGGTQDNKVVQAVARALREHGLHVLRFDFRGAGGSEGSHDEGRGELEDARAALDAVADLAGLPQSGAESQGALLAAGFSFGAWVALRAGLDDPRVGALLAVAPPVNHYDFGAIARADKPLAVIHAAGDELVPTALVERFVASCARPPFAVGVSGAGHLFHARLAELREVTGRYLDLLAGRDGNASPASARVGSGPSPE